MSAWRYDETGIAYDDQDYRYDYGIAPARSLPAIEHPRRSLVTVGVVQSKPEVQ